MGGRRRHARRRIAAVTSKVSEKKAVTFAKMERLWELLLSWMPWRQPEPVKHRDDNVHEPAKDTEVSPAQAKVSRTKPKDWSTKTTFSRQKPVGKMPPPKTRPVIQVVEVENREVHEGYMREAIAMAESALQTDETPVGCVFVHDGKIIGRGMNDTNRSLNGTRHAEIVAITQLSEKYDLEVLKKTDLYVTVEPCIMCASALRQFGIRAVYFGCWNDRFGGNGGVLNIHNEHSVNKPYPSYGGIFREDAIMLLRRFYIQENVKAPEPKQKKTRELKTTILPINAPPHDTDATRAEV